MPGPKVHIKVYLNVMYLQIVFLMSYSASLQRIKWINASNVKDGAATALSAIATNASFQSGSQV